MTGGTEMVDIIGQPDASHASSCISGVFLCTEERVGGSPKMDDRGT